MSLRTRFLGLDLGQVKDHATLGLVDRVVDAGPVDPGTFEPTRVVRYELPFLERVALGTSYPAVVERVVSVCERLRVGGAVEVVMDATGVGRAVFDLLRGSRVYELVAVVVTGSGSASQHGVWWHVPKRDIVASLVVAFQRGDLRIASKLEGAEALVTELTNFQRRVSAAGNASYGNSRESPNDDLVSAVSLATWRATLPWPLALGGRRPLF